MRLTLKITGFKTWFYWVFALLLVYAGSTALAQTVEIGEEFKKLTAAEERDMRAILAQPIPENSAKLTLAGIFGRKVNAAHRLNDEKARETILRQWAIAIPESPSPRKALALLLYDKGERAAAMQFAEQALALESAPTARANAMTYVLQVMYGSRPREETLKMADSTRVYLQQLEKQNQWNENGWRNIFVSGFRLEGIQSSLYRQVGRWQASIDAANESERYARKALELAQRSTNSDWQYFSANDLAYAMSSRIDAYIAAKQYSNADQVLLGLRRLSREVSLRPRILALFYLHAGSLRQEQREFSTAENYATRAIERLTAIGYGPEHPHLLNAQLQLTRSFIGQKKWIEALQKIESLDALDAIVPALKIRLRAPYERGVVYFGNQRYAQAAPLFHIDANNNRKTYGESHFFVAQASGLEGASLWRTGNPANREKALPLLKAAVRNYMLASNADFLENITYRKERREEVFAAYLEAIVNTSDEDVTQAIGAADWIRGGSVQEALSDAAVRSAANTPALADVVRREQDARNEITGIRRYLSGEAGAASSPLPQIAAQMRERITLLEGQRVTLQAEIKAKFPDYERLVRPTPPTAQDIARQLDPRQALILLLPAPDAVYVWAVAADRPAAFVRANLTESQVTAMVSRLRSQLDFATGAKTSNATSGSPNDFDNTAAFALYDKLLAPLAPVWQGKTQLIIATGGALSQLPFGVLQTRAMDAASNSGPGNRPAWLIQEAAIAQVPSLSAWLAIKTIAKSKAAPDAFAGWGDPAFGPLGNNTPRTTTVAASTTGPVIARSIALTRGSTLANLDSLDKPTAPPSALRYADIPPLPDTRDELLAIARSLKADASRDVLLGTHATRASVLAASRSGQLANKRVIAFATHGLMAGDLPNLNQPALAMAATGIEAQNPLAPLLTLEDVLTLKLNADWVVLSACNTAAADGRAEEALSGLARGFFYAGSRSLLVTHWAVESESAKELTTATFAHYSADPQAPKAESLRQGMLKVMAMPQYSHPAYWAPYALVGDGGR